MSLPTRVTAFLDRWQILYAFLCGASVYELAVQYDVTAAHIEAVIRGVI